MLHLLSLSRYSIPILHNARFSAIASLVNASITGATSASRRPTSRRRGKSGVNGAVSYRYHNRFVNTTVPGNVPLFGAGA